MVTVDAARRSVGCASPATRPRSCSSATRSRRSRSTARGRRSGVIDGAALAAPTGRAAATTGRCCSTPTGWSRAGAAPAGGEDGLAELVGRWPNAPGPSRGACCAEVVERAEQHNGGPLHDDAAAAPAHRAMKSRPADDRPVAGGSRSACSWSSGVAGIVAGARSPWRPDRCPRAARRPARPGGDDHIAAHRRGGRPGDRRPRLCDRAPGGVPRALPQRPPGAGPRSWRGCARC